MIKTIKYKSEKEWLEKRSLGVGGSDVAALLGVSPWSNRIKLWVKKTGQEKEETVVNESMDWGNKLEPLLLEEYVERTKHKVVKPKHLLFDTENYMVGSFDGICPKNGVGVEFKCVGPNASHKWENDQIPIDYFLQVQHYMHLTGMPKWDICPFFGSSMEIRTVERDEKVIKDIVDKSRKFWTEFVLTKTRPKPIDPMEEMATANYLKTVAVVEKFLAPTPFEVDRMVDFLITREANKDLEDQIEEFETMFKNRIAEASGIVFPNGAKITWKRNKSSEVTDWEGVAKTLKASSKLIAKFTSEKEGNRVFRVTGPVSPDAPPQVEKK